MIRNLLNLILESVLAADIDPNRAESILDNAYALKSQSLHGELTKETLASPMLGIRKKIQRLAFNITNITNSN